MPFVITWKPTLCLIIHFFMSSLSSRDNYVYLQMVFEHLTYEKREDIPSYGAESPFGKCIKMTVNKIKAMIPLTLGST